MKTKITILLLTICFSSAFGQVKGKKVASSKNDTTIDISQIPPGIYIIKVLLTQGEVLTKKILK